MGSKYLGFTRSTVFLQSLRPLFLLCEECRQFLVKAFDLVIC